jgi:arginyl-tRNA synthetase
VLCDDGELRKARLVLVGVLRSILRSGLALLGIETPERM